MPTVQELVRLSTRVQQLKAAIRRQQWSTNAPFAVMKSNTKAVKRLKTSLTRANYDLRQCILLMAAARR